jgi:outer membrane protein insertion porin family
VGSIERRVYSPTQAEQDTAAIAQAYVNAGRVNAVVSPAIIRREGGTVDLVFQIAEGGVTEIERISFVGNRPSEKAAAQRARDAAGGLLRQIIRADTFVAERIEFDRQALTDFYRSRGYADVTVENVDVNLTAERDAYLITCPTSAQGQRLHLRHVTRLQRDPRGNPSLLQRQHPGRAGEIYTPVAVENDIARIEALALREGINFRPRGSRASHPRRAGASRLHVRYALVPASASSSSASTSRESPPRSTGRSVADSAPSEGDPFNPAEIRESAERIRALGYFSDAEVEAREGSSPRPGGHRRQRRGAAHGLLSFGANYSSDAGPRCSQLRRGELPGPRPAARLRAASAGQPALSFDFTEPQFLGRDLELGLDLSYRQTDNADALYDTDSFRFSPSLASRRASGPAIGLLRAGIQRHHDVSRRRAPIIQREARRRAT